MGWDDINMASFRYSKPRQCRHRDTFPRWLRRCDDYTDKFEQMECLPSQRTVGIGANSFRFRLPVETLARIFHYSQLASYDYSKKCYRNMGWCWITITHVCKYWREVAIGAHELWSYIDVVKHASKDQTAMYLTRSGNSPIVVIYGMRDGDAILGSCIERSLLFPRLLLALEHLPRICELRIESFPEHSEVQVEIWDALTRNPAPMLRTFGFHTDCKKMYDLKTLFAKSVSKLEELTLYLNSPSYAAPVMRGLKRLLIAPFSTSVNLRDIFSILQENRDMEELSLLTPTFEPESDLLHLEGSTILTMSSIELSSLKELTLHRASYNQLCCFFQNINLPGIVGWDISCDDYPIKHQGADPRSAIPCNLNDGNNCATLKLRIFYDCLDFRSEFCSNTEQCSQRNITYSWGRGAEVGLGELVSVVCSVIKGGFWQSTRILTVEIEGEMSNSVSPSENWRRLPWVQLLEMFPYLEELTVNNFNIEDSAHAKRKTHLDLLKALAGPHKDEDEKIHIICPNLLKLHLVGMNFEFGIEHLIQFLSMRAINWKRLHKLLLTQTYQLKKSVLKSLKERGDADDIEAISTIVWLIGEG